MGVYCAIAQRFEVCFCVVDSNLGQLFIFPLKERAVMGVVDLVVCFALPFSLDTSLLTHTPILTTVLKGDTIMIMILESTH